MLDGLGKGQEGEHSVSSLRLEIFGAALLYHMVVHDWSFFFQSERFIVFQLLVP